MKTHQSSELTHNEVERLANDILRLCRNPVFDKIIQQRCEDGLLSEKGKRKQTLQFLARQELSRRSLVQRSLPNPIWHEACWVVMLDLFLRRDDPKGVSAKAASLASGLPPSTALRFIEKLEQAGLVTAEWSKDDRRRKILSLTPDGHAVVTRTLLALENLLDPLDRSNRQSRQERR